MNSNNEVNKKASLCAALLAHVKDGMTITVKDGGIVAVE